MTQAFSYITRKFMHIFFAAFLIFLSPLSTAVHASEGIKNKRYQDPDPFYGYCNADVTTEILEAYLDKLEKAVKSDDPDKIAQVMSYPFNFNSKKKIKIRNKAEFKKLYSKIFTEPVKKAAIEGKVEEVGWRGFMINNGIIWIYPPDGIIAINDPEDSDYLY